MAEVVFRALPATSLRTAPDDLELRVPALVGVTGTVKTPGVVSVTVPMVTSAARIAEVTGGNRARVHVLAEGHRVGRQGVHGHGPATLVIDDADQRRRGRRA